MHEWCVQGLCDHLGDVASAVTPPPPPSLFSHELLVLPAWLLQAERTDVGCIYMTVGLGTCPLFECQACCPAHCGGNEGSSVVMQSLPFVG